MAVPKGYFEQYIRLFPSEFQPELKAKFAYKKTLEADDRLKIPNRVWLAYLTPRESYALARVPHEFQHVKKLKEKMLETFTHPKQFLSTRDPLHRSGDCVTLSILATLYDLHERKILLPQERYYEWLEAADHFGLWKLRYLLEDAIFRTFDPENFSLFESVVQKKMLMDQELVFAVRDIVGTALRRAGLASFAITNRKKNIYGVYKKVALKKININEVFDVHGFRILMSTPGECYKALEVLHRLWPHVPERLKDYIKSPKANGYQSIHTVLSCLQKKPIEFQIRTHEMDVVAASGPANHAEYKKAKGKVTFEKSS